MGLQIEAGVLQAVMEERGIGMGQDNFEVQGYPNGEPETRTTPIGFAENDGAEWGKTLDQALDEFRAERGLNVERDVGIVIDP